MTRNVIREAGRKLREIRDANGLTMNDVDKKVREYAETHEVTAYDFDSGFPQSVQSRIELGKTYRPPNAVEMAKYAVALGINPNEMFELFGLPVPTAPKLNGNRNAKLAMLERELAKAPDEVVEQANRLLDLVITQVRSMTGPADF